MKAQIPPAFKPMTPFVRRAEELEKDESRGDSKLVAYFCRQYAMELGLRLRENDSSETATQFLLNMMSKLEQDKGQLPPFTQEEGKIICKQFADEVFGKADQEDRAGSANKNTARTFYAAGSFFEILKQFGEVDAEVAAQIKYCKWKATDILKAISEGRKPLPGGPEEQQDQSLAGDAGLPDTAVGAAESEPSFPQVPTQSELVPSLPSEDLPPAPPPVASPPPTAPSAPPVFPSVPRQPETNYSASQQRGSGVGPRVEVYETKPPFISSISEPKYGGRKSKEQISDALELSKFAVAALEVNDTNLAMERLYAALTLLQSD